MPRVTEVQVTAPAVAAAAVAAAQGVAAPQGVGSAAAAPAAVSSDAVSLAIIETLFSRLLEQTKTEICRETAVTMAEHLSGLQTQVSSVRADLDVERVARARRDEAVDARLTAVEDAMRARPPAQPTGLTSANSI